MDYKVIIADEDVTDEEAEAVFAALTKLVVEGKNIDRSTFGGFLPEGREAVLVGTTWGTDHPDTEDMEAISAMYPDFTFHIIQVGGVLNGNHFERLRHYTLSIYKGGNLLETMKPEPIVWKSSQVIEYLPSPW